MHEVKSLSPRDLKIFNKGVGKTTLARSVSAILEGVMFACSKYNLIRG